MVAAKAADYGTLLAEFSSKVRSARSHIETSGLSALDAEMKRFLPVRLYDAMAPVFGDINATAATMMSTLMGQLDAML